MKPTPFALEFLARHYERRLAGRTGEATRDVVVDLEDLLRAAGAGEGERRAIAEQQLRDAEQAGILKLEPLHKRDRSLPCRVRFSPAQEQRLFEMIGRDAPTVVRQSLAGQFTAAASYSTPSRWQEAWKNWCERMRSAALAGQSISPFDRQPSVDNDRLLKLLPLLLSWEGESLVRFASCVLCGDSKALETLAPKEGEGESSGRLRGKLGRLLEDITCGQVRALDDLGILPNPRSALVHGPLSLRLDGQWLDLGRLTGAFRLAQSDIERAEEVRTSSRRCLTVENETSFHELAKLQSGVLLVQTSYPGSGTLALLQRLPAETEYWHFGDSDEAGFDILRVLSQKSARSFQPLHMQPGRTPFEQESLGRPTLKKWPFYAEFPLGRPSDSSKAS